ncbi:MAG: glycosyltransferase family 2 protein [Angustibacter sp.]
MPDRPPAQQPSVTWVMVSYGGVDDARELYDSLAIEPADPTRDAHVVIACNGAGDGDLARRVFADELARGGVTVLDFPDNPGYLPALRRALSQVEADGAVVLSNCDLTADAEFLPALREALERFPQALTLAPSIVNDLGQDQNPHLMRPRPTWWLRGLAIIHRFPPLADVMLLRRGGHSSLVVKHSVEGQTMWSGHGSCVVFAPDFFTRGGSLDYPFPLFGEELWIGTEVERLGGEVRYVPTLRLRHRAHASTGSGRRRGWVARVQYEGLAYWAREGRRRGW